MQNAPVSFNCDNKKGKSIYYRYKCSERSCDTDSWSNGCCNYVTLIAGVMDAVINIITDVN